jgi:cytochrome P450
MKRKLLQAIGQLVMAILRKADYFITGSNTGISIEEERKDPYSVYKILRSRGRILRSYTNRGWMVVGFDEAQELFLDSRFGSDLRTNKPLSRMIRLAADGKKVSFLDDPAMLNLDPPDHTRLRKLATHGFLHKHILSLEPRVTEIVDRCLESYDTQSGTFNIVTQIAKPLPAIVIAELLGLPESDLTRFQKLSIDLLGLTALGDDKQMERGAKANEDLISYFSGIIDDKRRNPDQALISRLIAAEEEGDRLSAEELYSTAILLLIAGHETTTRLISNGIYTLLQHPEQLALLRDNPDLAENAIEEMLRFEPPIQFVVRFAREDLTFHGKKIKKNQLVAPIILSANRDPAANDNPDVFDIERDNIKHVSFGYGIHLCLGMTLARLEGRIAINKLLQRFPDMTLADQPLEWSSLMLIRGLENLIIETNDSNNKSDLQSETDAA